jgi:ABC-2 type transport system ATP-binding protein
MTAGAAASVEARELTKAYTTGFALDGVSFAIGPGEVVGLLGPNGAGKTTAIRVLTTILAPTAGTFATAGVPHTRPREIRRRVGVLPESAGYPPQQTGLEHLIYHARLYGRSRDDARAVAAALLDDVGLTERGATLIQHYSRGMRQRLGIARALVNDPVVVFLDEPTLGLDPQGQAQILATVRRIAREHGATVILSTHVLAEVEDVCTRVLILNRGRLIADGTVAEVTRRAAAPRRGRFRVPVRDRERAIEVLRRVGAVRDVRADDDRPDALTADLMDSGAGDAAGALAAAGIGLLAFELEGARLSDAFLAMTREG